MPLKDHNKYSISNLKEMEIYKLPKKQFKIIISRNFNYLQETSLLYNFLKKENNTQIKQKLQQINRKKKNQPDILELANTMNKMKNTIKIVKKRNNQTDEKNCKLNTRAFKNVLIMEKNINKRKYRKHIGFDTN